MRKPRYKLKGIMLLTTVVAVAAWILLAGGIFLTQSGSFQMFSAAMVQRQAQYLAMVDEKALSQIRYDELTKADSFTKLGLHTNRAEVKSANVTGWEDEITVGSEKKMSNTSDGVAWPYKIVSVNIYRQGDTEPRYTLQVPFVRQAETYSKEEVAEMLKRIKATFTTADVEKMFKKK